MSHSAYLYDVRIHPPRKKKDLRSFGDCLGTGGVWLGDLVSAGMATIDETQLHIDDPEKYKSIAVFEQQIGGFPLDDSGNPLYVGCTTVVSEFGVRARLRLQDHGPDPVERREDDQQDLRLALAMRLPRNGTYGTLAVHRVAGKTAARAVRKVLKDIAAAHDLKIDVLPRISDEELLGAVRAGRIKAIAMVPVDKQNIFSAASGGQKKSVDVFLSATARAGFLQIPAKLRNFILGNSGVGNVEVAGDDYGAVRVTVELENGKERTFTVGATDHGFAFSYDLNPGTVGQDGIGPQPSALGFELVQVLTA